MANVSPYQLFWNWCFDRNPKSPIPEPEVLLKYNSPINATFILKSLIRVARLNHYLNSTINNIGIRYIDLEDLLHFTKQCIRDFKVQRKDIHYSPWKTKDTLFVKLRERNPILKPYDVELLVEVIQKKPQNEKDAIFSALGIEKPKKEKLKSNKGGSSKISLKQFLSQNFSTMKVTAKEVNL
ncbi:hypothetical protein KAR91_74100 [Candidatus Pacearchaeota archaeon]|nr:hypothetical protein [Candidatus Pacearchaeota archaeon]